MTPIEETVETLDTQDTIEETPPVAIRYDCSWNHNTGRVEWQRIEEPITVKPKPVEQPARHNRAARRTLRQYLRRLYRKASRRQAEVQPATCPRCTAPMLGMRFNRYDTTPDGEPGKTVIGTMLWRCQCQPQRQPRRARYECDMCHVELWQTTEERKHNTVCDECGEQLRELWQADAASASEAMRRATQLREKDDALHRAAQEAMLPHAALSSLA